MEFCEEHFKACCILHNFVRVRGSFRLEDTLEVVGWTDFTQNLNSDDISVRNLGNRSDLHKIRDAFAEYFISPASEIHR